jgi:two-component system chemotaxis response regulator CheY
MPDRILVVDDSETVRELVSHILKDSGFEVITAENGYHALDVLEGHRVAMIVTDIRMPQMNGLDMIHQIRCRSGYDDIPIVVISSEADRTQTVERKHVLAWIQKPFRSKTLLDSVHSGLAMTQNVNKGISR